MVWQGQILLNPAEETIQLGLIQIHFLVTLAMVPHEVHNIGTEKVRLIGFFPSATIASIFDHPLLPDMQDVLSSAAREDIHLELPNHG